MAYYTYDDVYQDSKQFSKNSPRSILIAGGSLSLPCDTKVHGLTVLLWLLACMYAMETFAIISRGIKRKFVLFQ